MKILLSNFKSSLIPLPYLRSFGGTSPSYVQYLNSEISTEHFVLNVIKNTSQLLLHFLT